MQEAVSLEQLIKAAEEGSRSGLPLDRVSVAVRMSAELVELSDRLVNHFVQEARGTGCSWAEIGNVLGVSRQAAQQRFAGGWLGRLVGRGKRGSTVPWVGYTDGARRVMELAQEEARRLDHNYVGTEHLLLGISRESTGVGGKALEGLTISLEQVRAWVEKEIGRGDPASVRLPIPVTPRAKKALDAAVGRAKDLGHNYVGTEHMLLALAEIGEGAAWEILRDLGADEERVRRSVLRLLAA